MSERFSALNLPVYGLRVSSEYLLKHPSFTPDVAQSAFSRILEDGMQEGFIQLPPTCPACLLEIDRICTDQRTHLVFAEGKWQREIIPIDVFSCPNCEAEFGPQDLDLLGVPNELR